jgi:hypothetical protein
MRALSRSGGRSRGCIARGGFSGAFAPIATQLARTCDRVAAGRPSPAAAGRRRHAGAMGVAAPLAAAGAAGGAWWSEAGARPPPGRVDPACCDATGPLGRAPRSGRPRRAGGVVGRRLAPGAPVWCRHIPPLQHRPGSGPLAASKHSWPAQRRGRLPGRGARRAAAGAGRAAPASPRRAAAGSAATAPAPARSANTLRRARQRSSRSRRPKPATDRARLKSPPRRSRPRAPQARANDIEGRLRTPLSASCPARGAAAAARAPPPWRSRARSRGRGS